MESIRGKMAPQIDANTLANIVLNYQQTLIDIGTGDGQFVRAAAKKTPGVFAIGVDACRENLRDSSRNLPDNALFVIANAGALPRELYRLASHITINFPWGSLLEGLLDGDPAMLASITSVAKPGALLEVRLNKSAVSEAGWTLEAGAARVAQVLRGAGFSIQQPKALGPAELKACPTSWAKRLAFGRDPHALYIKGFWRGE